MELISRHKVAIVMVLGVFLPTSNIIFGTLGFISGFVNWGVVFAIGAFFVGRWAYESGRTFLDDALDDEYEWVD